MPSQRRAPRPPETFSCSTSLLCAGVGIAKPSMSRVSAQRAGPARVSAVTLGGRVSMGVPGVGGMIRPTPAMLQRVSKLQTDSTFV